jgi:hypothetical protein
MPDGSFRDLSAGNGSGNGRGAAVSSFGTSGGGGSTLNNGNYSTFFAADPVRGRKRRWESHGGAD